MSSWGASLRKREVYQSTDKPTRRQSPFRGKNRCADAGRYHERRAEHLRWRHRLRQDDKAGNGTDGEEDAGEIADPCLAIIGQEQNADGG